MHSKKQIQADLLKYKNTIQPKLDKPDKPKKPRKKRSDAKSDVKIPLTTVERQQVKILARANKMTVTEYCSHLINLYIERNWDYKEVNYHASEKCVHATFKQNEYDELFSFSVKWDCSLRQAAHRILLNALYFERGGIDIEVI